MVPDPDEESRLNMPLARMTLDDDREKRRLGPLTVIGRLREYARVRHRPQVNAFQDSPFAKIAEMQENAGIRGSGIRYDMISTEEDPEVTPCLPDGGLGELAERAGHSLTQQIRCQEVATAINQMPEMYRSAIFAMYHVEHRDRVRTFTDAAAKCGKAKGTYQLILTRAYGWLEGRLCLPIDREPSGQ